MDRHQPGPGEGLRLGALSPNVDHVDAVLAVDVTRPELQQLLEAGAAQRGHERDPAFRVAGQVRPGRGASGGSGATGTAASTTDRRGAASAILTSTAGPSGNGGYSPRSQRAFSSWDVDEDPQRRPPGHGVELGRDRDTDRLLHGSHRAVGDAEVVGPQGCGEGAGAPQRRLGPRRIGPPARASQARAAKPSGNSSPSAAPPRSAKATRSSSKSGGNATAGLRGAVRGGSAGRAARACSCSAIRRSRGRAIACRKVTAVPAAAAWWPSRTRRPGAPPGRGR